MEATGIIKEISDYIHNNTYSNKFWCETQALFILSIVMGFDRWIYTMMGKVRFNLFVINIGPSGLANKSIVFNEYTIPILKALEDKCSHKLLISCDTTVASIIEYLSNGEKFEDGNEEFEMYTNYGGIILDEFSSLVKDTKKEYNRKMFEVLSKLFDCSPLDKYTKKDKFEKCDRPYISLISATTPHFFEDLEKSFFYQGLANRIIFIISEPTQVYDKTNAEEFFPDQIAEHEDDNYVDELVERLYNIMVNTPEKFIITNEAKQKLWDFQCERKKLSEEIYNGNPKSVFYSFIDREPFKMFKIAGLHAVSHSEGTIGLEETEEIVINETDVDYAIFMVKQFDNDFERLVKDWEIFTIKERPVYTDELSFNLIKNIIKANGGMCSRTTLSKKSRMNAKDLSPVLKTMVCNEEIFMIEENTGKPGRKPQFFYLDPPEQQTTDTIQDIFSELAETNNEHDE